MAESSPETRERIRALVARRWRARPMVAVAAIALAGAATPAGAPTPPPEVPLERPRLARTRIRVLAANVVSVPTRTLRSWFRLLLARPAIRATPTSRSDTPVLPTVGRPRDVPA